MQTENRATEAERTVSKLQKEIDRLEGMLLLQTDLLYQLLLPFYVRIGLVSDTFTGPYLTGL